MFQTGGVIGTLILPWIADKFGRKWAIAVVSLSPTWEYELWLLIGIIGQSSVLGIISGAVLAESANVAEFLVFHFFAGASALMILAADIHAVMLIFGYTVQGWVGSSFCFWKTGGSNTWRPPIALQCTWPFFLLLGLYWSSESPRWLVINDRIEEAHTILQNYIPISLIQITQTHEKSYQIQKQLMIVRTLGS